MTGPDAYPFPPLPTVIRYALAVASVVLVFFINTVSGALVDDGTHFLLLGTAVLASAWFVGTGPAIAATILGGILGALDAGDSASPGTAMHLALFIVQGVLLTGVVAELRAARRTSEHQAVAARAARRDGEAASRLKDEFLATLSHELRTPLNAVLGWVHLLRTGKLDAATSTRGLESIERNIRLQAQVTSDLLDVSRAFTGTLQVESKPISLAEVVRHAMSAVGPAASAKGVSVTASLEDAPVVVLGDATRLRQIAWHLLANAIKFTPRDGSVHVVVRGSGTEAELLVSDSGRGIDPQFLPRIFDSFTQADGSPTRVAGGLGVGLSLVRELVELHGGAIRAQNRTDGPGALFVMSLPLQAASLLERTQPAARSRCATPGCPPLEGVRVLLLDEDVEAREVMRTVLQDRGAAVRTADTIGDALESLERWRPDVLVSDRVSPEHDSYSIVGKVSTLEAERGGRIPALALTTFARTDEWAGSMLASARSHLPKPLEPATLMWEVGRLSGRERRRVQRQ